MSALKVGDMVRTGVHVCGDWLASNEGRIVAQSTDGSVSEIDVMSHRGGAPWIRFEATSDLRAIESAVAA